MAERDGLENRCRGNSTQGSNPCFSAMIHNKPALVAGLLFLAFWLSMRSELRFNHQSPVQAGTQQLVATKTD